jgi:hypothetical protein
LIYVWEHFIFGNQMNDSTLEKIKLFLQQDRWSYIDTDTVSSATKIEKDLMLTGDDAIEFIVDYGKYFKIDVSRFMAADYFDGEGHDFFGDIARLFSRKNESDEKILTVGDLEKGIIAGKLDESVINS